MTRLYEFYNSTVKSEMIKISDYKSVMEVPRIQKVTINMGVGEATADKKILENALSDLEKITGQKPFTTRAKKSIATCKVRMGYPI